MTLSPNAITFLESRALDPELASRMGIYSARRGVDGGDPQPNPAGNILVFPYIDGGREVNVKFRARNRDGSKKFWQRAGARKTFFNADVLDDPALISGAAALVITEGEFDTLAAIQAGHPFTVSVPEGAPPARDGQGNLITVPDTADDVNPEHDDKYKFVFNNWDRLKRIKRIILATDADEPGQILMLELARRLNRSRCAFIEYPKDPLIPDDKTGELRPVKDLNEVLQHYGPSEVMRVLTAPKPFPVRGLYKLHDFPEAPPLQVYSTGFAALDPYVNLYKSAFIVCSGLPGGGKSALTTQIAYNMARIHGWRTVIASFEMHVRPILENMLMGFYIYEKDIRRGLKEKRIWSATEKREARDFIQEHFSFVALAPEDDETEADVDWVLDRFMDAVIRDGACNSIIDPWNELDHARRGGENIADYTNRAIRKVKRFSHSAEVCTTIVAHPTKAAADTVRSGAKMGLYDISDGATWANKAEIGLICSRSNPATTDTEIGVRKVKFHESGQIGDTSLNFNLELRQFIEHSSYRTQQVAE